MKRRVILLFVVFVFFILVFALQKVIFILMHGKVNDVVSVADMALIFFHGLPIDMSMSGYLTAIPAFVIIASVWAKGTLLNKILAFYFCIVGCIIAVMISVDVILYAHWGFHIDPVILFYLRNPYEVVVSGTLNEWLVGTLIALIFMGVFYSLYFISIRQLFMRLDILLGRLRKSLILTFLTGVLFLPIRGGVTVSTMNISHAYFSDRMFLNHAAINPVFNFFYLLNKQDDLESRYRFFEKEEVEQCFERLMAPHPLDDNASCEAVRPSLLRVERPNIILFVLESFSFDVATDSTVAPNMARYAREGVFFDNFYANTFRTDRGLTSIFSGYPAHPTTAILKYPKKTDKLPAIPKVLRTHGYDNQSLYYGGDINFANMRSYFVGACGIQNIISDKDFPVKNRFTKWGTPDKFVIEKAYSDLAESKPDEPFLKIVLTLSSHEPFDVPTKLFDDPFLNSVHYVDECIGQFVSDFQKTALWDHTWIVFISDHAIQGYPLGRSNNDRKSFHIPMIWIGGAVAQPTVISHFSSQIDLAATLLSQLGFEHADFGFSKDILHPLARKFSFYTYIDGFCMIDSANIFLYDNNQQKALIQEGDPAIEKEAKAFFQMMCIDFGNR